MKKNIGAKIFAVLALFGILIGIVGTGILYFLESHTSNNVEILSPEEIQKYIDASGVDIVTTQSGSQIQDDSIVDIISELDSETGAVDATIRNEEGTVLEEGSNQ